MFSVTSDSGSWREEMRTWRACLLDQGDGFRLAPCMHTDTLSPEPGGTAVDASLVPGAEVSVRRADQGVGVYPWASVSAGVLAAAAPWRMFRWYQGQQHYSRG